MNWKIFIASFLAIFTAELADKTQIVSTVMSAKTNKPLIVFLGSVCGYALVTIISVFLGSFFGHYVNENVMKIIGGVLFVFLGVLMILGKL